ncbi:MAG: hypothetical protein PHY73_02970 [Candidatus Omnitrophica bacterium]|nr:hypothetical protein [Candidatus Omnitrophota bacterium]
MNFKKFLTAILCVTAVALIYIQMQVKIYDFAYQGKNKEKEIFKLIDDNGHVVYNIAKLKSSSSLSERFLAKNSDIDFLDSQHIVHLNVPTQLAANKSSDQNSVFKRTTGLLASVFSLKSVAEAKPIR